MDDSLEAPARCLTQLATINRRLSEASIRLRHVAGVSGLSEDFSLYLVKEGVEVEMYIDFDYEGRGRVFWISTKLASNIWSVEAEYREGSKATSDLTVVAKVKAQRGTQYPDWEKSFQSCCANVFDWADEFPKIPV